MSHRYPFEDEDSSMLDSFELLDDGREPATEGDAFGEEGVDKIPLLEDVVESDEGLYGDLADTRLETDTNDNLDEPYPGSPDARARLSGVVRRRLESELGQLIASAVDEALRPAVLDLESQLRGELFDILRQRIHELIDEALTAR
jgi:hypothetical protein